MKGLLVLAATVLGAWQQGMLAIADSCQQHCTARPACVLVAGWRMACYESRGTTKAFSLARPADLGAYVGILWLVY